jgi:catechol 2,3-dioxygenase-like lactoylglutathione lyase family enzyme
MSLLSGVNHIAILTQDLDRFVGFYSEIFGLEVVFAESSPGFRHAILRAGPDSWLHPAEISGNPHATAVPKMFERGHLDHFALTAASLDTFKQARMRLLARGASDGAIETLGPFHSLRFNDPDGMHVEVVVIVDPTLQDIHEPRPLAVTGE